MDNPPMFDADILNANERVYEAREEGRLEERNRIAAKVRERIEFATKEYQRTKGTTMAYWKGQWEALLDVNAILEEDEE